MTRRLGQDAENKACEFLISQGLTPLSRNYQQKTGEIDLIMRDKKTIVFVEVKLRNRKNYATVLESISQSKQRRIIRTALCYLQSHHLLDQVDCRFDVVTLENTEHQPRCQWLKHAFEDDGQF